MTQSQRQHWQHQLRQAERLGYHHRADDLANKLGLTRRRAIA